MKSLILKEVNRFTVILIYMFGIYVILHGHLSPGVALQVVPLFLLV